LGLRPYRFGIETLLCSVETDTVGRHSQTADNIAKGGGLCPYRQTVSVARGGP